MATFRRVWRSQRAAVLAELIPWAASLAAEQPGQHPLEERVPGQERGGILSSSAQQDFIRSAAVLLQDQLVWETWVRHPGSQTGKSNGTPIIHGEPTRGWIPSCRHPKMKGQ